MTLKDDVNQEWKSTHVDFQIGGTSSFEFERELLSLRYRFLRVGIVNTMVKVDEDDRSKRAKGKGGEQNAIASTKMSAQIRWCYASVGF